MRRKSIVAILMGLIVLCSACGAPPQATTTTSAPIHLQLAMYSATARVQQGKVTSVSVSCKPGEQMLGGGFGTSDLFEYAAYIEASYPSDATTWTVVGSAPASYFDVEVDVYCAPAMIPFGIQVVRATSAPAGRATCPQETVLLGGGFQSSQPIDVSRPQGNGWLGASSDTSIQVYALCAASHILRGQVVISAFNAHSSSHGYDPSGGDAVCPAGQIATGGGFEGGDLIVGSEMSGPSLAGWSVAAGGDADVTVSAVCVLLQA
jgi:hypothetical protein